MPTWIIYELKCETGKIYVGKTRMKRLNDRLNKHRGKQNRNSNSSTKDFINPTIEEICRTDDKQTSFDLEQQYIKERQSCNIIKLLDEDGKKISHAKAQLKYRETENGRAVRNKAKRDYYYRHREKCLLAMKLYNQSKKNK